MAGRKLGKAEAVARLEDPRRFEVFRAADQIRAEGKEPASLRNVWARVKRNAGVAGSNQSLSGHLAEWTKERSYDAAIETAGMPKSVSTQMSKACVTLWEAAQAEAAAIMERERRRMDQAIAAERDLRSEAFGMVDARDAVIEGLRAEIARHAAELEEMRKHVGVVRARDFWQRVAQEVWEVLPEREAMHVNDIAQRVGHEFVKEAEEHPGVWGSELLRGVIDQRVKFKKLFASEGGGRYRRRRPEDDVAA